MIARLRRLLLEIVPLATEMLVELPVFCLFDEGTVKSDSVILERSGRFDFGRQKHLRLLGPRLPGTKLPRGSVPIAAR